MIDIHMVFDYQRAPKKIVDPFEKILDRKKSTNFRRTLKYLIKRKIVVIVIVRPL